IYGTNWYFILSEQSYFEALGRPPLLQHLWSLAVEEQFYLVWPLLVAVGVRYLNRPGLSTVCLLGALASALHTWLLYVPDADPSRLYYGTDTRAAGLLAGAALAVGWSPSPRVPGCRSTVAPDLLGGLAVIALGVQMATTPETDPFLYRGKLLLCAMTTVVIIAVAVHPGARLGRLLDALPLRFIGVRSYGLYLWHWPIVMVTRPELDVPIDGAPLLLLRLGLTAAIAELSFRFIETPMRAGALGRVLAALRGYCREPRLRWAGAGAGVLSVSLVTLTVWLGVAVAGATPPPVPEDLGVLTTVEIAPPSELAGTAVWQPGDPGLPRAVGPPGVTPVAVAAVAVVSRPAATDISAIGRTVTLPEAAPAQTPIAQPPAVAAPARQIVAIGDSVMLGAASELRAALGPDAVIDAQVGRQVVTAIKLLRARAAAGRLGDIVLVHLGNNGTFTPEQFDEIMAVLGPERTAIFVTVKVPRRWQRSVNETLQASVERYRHALLIDWNRHSAKLREAFGRDGVHLRPTGRRIYAQLIQERLSGL
ncbi:MAG: acyltransferase family protein, partial [Gammaproteobacteria bacterium]